MKHRHRLSCLGALLALAVLLSPIHTVRLAAQQADVAKAATVFQAVYIFNITRYVYFPPAKSSGDYIIGVLGRPEILNNLERTAALKKASLTGQQMRVVVYDSPSPAMSECHIIYVSDKFSTRLPQVAKAIKGQPTLIVTEGDNNANGIPAISMCNGEKKFQVNNKAIEANSLKVSADFLRFAALVQ